jgi:hypothetical protein
MPLELVLLCQSWRKKPPVDKRRVLVTVNGKAVLAHLVDRILGLYSFSSNGEI